MNSLIFDPATEKTCNLSPHIAEMASKWKTPVWIAEVAPRYYIFSAGDAGKVKRIRATPRVRIAACDVRGNIKSAWMEARARILSDAALIAQVRKALRSKYGL